MANKIIAHQRRMSNRWLWFMLAFLAIGLMGALGVPPQTVGPGQAEGQAPWRPARLWGRFRARPTTDGLFAIIGLSHNQADTGQQLFQPISIVALIVDNQDPWSFLSSLQPNHSSRRSPPHDGPRISRLHRNLKLKDSALRLP